MALSNDIVLRPRFQLELSRSNQTILKAFEQTKGHQKNFVVSRIDNHVFIRIPKAEHHYWSPQLHLEVLPKDQDNCTVHGLFGPNPTIWTMFMFLHFIVAGLFIVFGIWAYSNWTLELPFVVQLTIMFLMVIAWVTLYLLGRMGRHSGKDQMHQLHDFMNDVLKQEHLL